MERKSFQRFLGCTIKQNIHVKNRKSKLFEIMKVIKALLNLMISNIRLDSILGKLHNDNPKWFHSKYEFKKNVLMNIHQTKHHPQYPNRLHRGKKNIDITNYIQNDYTFSGEKKSGRMSD